MLSFFPTVVLYGRLIFYIAFFVLLVIYLLEKITFYKKLNNSGVIEKILAYCENESDTKETNAQNNSQEDNHDE